ncbi:hypothetical protein [Corynebacterium striatum]|uniref:hypothetical protein n=1 Tax=Corynebacterium striatum TaxID=43770 RepID=UPI003B591390
MSKAQRTRKQQILDAALDVIVEEGVAGLTLRHVSDAGFGYRCSGDPVLPGSG